jgi:hypothetical protein
MGLCLAQNSTRLHHPLKATQQRVLGFAFTYRDLQRHSTPTHSKDIYRPIILGPCISEVRSQHYELSLALQRRSLQCLAARGTALWLISEAVVLGKHSLQSAENEDGPTIEAPEKLVTQTHWMTSSLLDSVLRVRSPNARLV